MNTILMTDGGCVSAGSQVEPDGTADNEDILSQLVDSLDTDMMSS